MISCILLTAGESSRFGSPKALCTIDGQKAIELLQQRLIQSTVDEIIIVTGHQEELIKPHVLNHSKVKLVHHKDYKFGQTSSFQTGLNSVDKSSFGFMLLPVDCPFIQTSTINAIIHQFCLRLPEILIPSYLDKRGHPPVFHTHLKQEILELPTNLGLNSLIAKHAVSLIPLNDPGITQTFNTPGELALLLNKKAL